MGLRHYLLSFFFPLLFKHPKIGKFLGIRYEDDLTWTTNRKESHVFMTGIFIKLFTSFTGMDVILTDESRKKFIRLQADLGNKINIQKYLSTLDGKVLTLQEFENFLSDSILKETNDVFEIVSPQCEKLLLKKLRIVQTIVNFLVGDRVYGIYYFIKNFKEIMDISKILKSVPEHKRLLLFVPQLTLVNNFGKMLITHNGDMSEIEPYDFLEPVSKFMVIKAHNDLVLVSRSFDKSNTPSNKAFGPKGLQCPGNIYTFKFIRSILEPLQKFDITVEGKPKFRTGRFNGIINKNDIVLNFGLNLVESQN